MIRSPRKFYHVLKNLVLLSGILAVCSATLFAQNASAEAVQKKPLPAAVERMLSETNIASIGHYHAVSNGWRAAFGSLRDRDRLKGFVGESVDFVEKLRQVYDIAANPGATEARITTLFRQRILDSDTLCRSLDKSLNDFCQALDDQDQSLLIKLKIDRQAGRTILARNAIDTTAFKGLVNTVVASSVKAVQDDMSRSVVSFVASEAIGMGVKSGARGLGINRTEEGSFADFLTGLIIDVGVGMVVDAATDPTPKMVANLEANLQNAERLILDGNGNSAGFVMTLRRITDERIAARRKLIEAEFSK